jgi:hypothetical protein
MESTTVAREIKLPDREESDGKGVLSEDGVSNIQQ